MVHEWLEFVDDLPEYCHYQDEGCDFYISCLECPFPRCLLDLPAGERYVATQWRRDEIIHRFSAGATIEQLAAAFFLNRSSVYRILNRPDD